MRTMRARDIIKRLEAEGWTRARSEGSHRIYKRPGFGVIVVPVHGLNRNVSVGVMQDIAKKAGWK